MNQEGPQKDRDRPSRFQRTRRWLWSSWTDAAPLVYRRSAHGKDRAKVLGVELFLFAREIVRGFFAVQGTARAAALAYTTLLSLIPLLVALSLVLRAYFAQVFPDLKTHADVFFNLILPYKSAQITYHLTRFAENAEAASTAGTLIFLLMSMRLFMAVEATVNQIWRVEKSRGYRQKLRAFTMLFFWGPLVIGLSFTTSATLRRSQYVGPFVENNLVQTILPFFVFFTAFTMLFWLVPATKVQIRSAAFGALVTTAAFELLRSGFGIYAEHLFRGNLNVIYGTLGLVVIFLVALELMWVVLLLGVQVSYVHQNFEGILRASERQLEEDPAFDAFFALRALVEITRRYQAREDAPSSYRLAEEFGATDPQMLAVLRRMEDSQIVKEIGGDWTGWVPGFDPDSIRVDEVIKDLEGGHRSVPPSAVDTAETRAVAAIFASLDLATRDALAKKTIGDLTREIYGVESVPAPLTKPPSLRRVEPGPRGED